MIAGNLDIKIQPQVTEWFTVVISLLPVSNYEIAYVRLPWSHSETKYFCSSITVYRSRLGGCLMIDTWSRGDRRKISWSRDLSSEKDVW